MPTPVASCSRCSAFHRRLRAEGRYRIIVVTLPVLLLIAFVRSLHSLHLPPSVFAHDSCVRADVPRSFFVWVFRRGHAIDSVMTVRIRWAWVWSVDGRMSFRGRHFGYDGLVVANFWSVVGLGRLTRNMERRSRDMKSADSEEVFLMFNEVQWSMLRCLVECICGYRCG